MAETSIVFKANDQISGSMKSMLGNSQALSKEFEDLQRKVGQLSQKNDAFNKSFASVSTQALEAKKSLKEAEDAFKKTGTEESRLNFENAKKQYKDLTDAAKSYQEASKDTRKAIRETQEDIRKLGDSSASSSGSGSELAAGTDMLSGLAKAGLGKMVGDTAQQAAQYYISSAYSSEMGNVLSGALGSAITGAAIGSIIPGVGTAVGGAIGAATGAIGGLVQNAQEEDSYMQAYAGTLTDTAESISETRLTSSSVTAAKREQDLLSVGTLLGSDSDAAKVLGDIKTMANVTPYIYDDLIGISKTLMVYGDTQDNILTHLTDIGDTGAALGMSTSDMDSVAQILGYISTSDKLDSTKLRQLRLKGINANQMLADYYGVSSSELSSMVSGGKISGSDAADILYQELAKNYGGMMAAQAETFTGKTSTVEGLQQNIENAQGDSYNSGRDPGLQQQIDWLQGSAGEALSSAYAMIGQGEAARDNREQQLYQDVMSGVLQGKTPSSETDAGVADEIAKLRTDYLNAQEEFYNGDTEQAGADMKTVIENAQSLAGVSSDIDDKMDIWDQQAEDTADYASSITSILDAYKDKWSLDQIKSRGILFYTGGDYEAPDSVTGDSSLIDDLDAYQKDYESSDAFGLRRVSKTGLYLLHQDETVKTAAESRAGSGATGQILITGNKFHVRQESDIPAIASELLRQINLGKMRSG
jgi:tape measure domain-containing protein